MTHGALPDGMMADPTLNAFRRFVADNNVWFAGRFPETPSSISTAEESLGVRLPAEVAWLLTTHRYWHATGICSLTDTVTDTLTARDSLELPHNLVVLYDHHDGGVVLLDTTTWADIHVHSIYITGWEFASDDIAGTSYSLRFLTTSNTSSTMSLIQSTRLTLHAPIGTDKMAVKHWLQRRPRVDISEVVSRSRGLVEPFRYLSRN